MQRSKAELQTCQDRAECLARCLEKEEEHSKHLESDLGKDRHSLEVLKEERNSMSSKLVRFCNVVQDACCRSGREGLIDAPAEKMTNGPHRLDARLGEVEAQVDQLQLQLASINGRDLVLKEQLMSVQTSFDQANNRWVEAESKLARTTAELKDADRRVAENLARLDETAGRLEETRVSTQTAQQRAESLKVDADVLRKAKETLEAALRSEEASRKQDREEWEGRLHVAEEAAKTQEERYVLSLIRFFSPD